MATILDTPNGNTVRTIVIRYVTWALCILSAATITWAVTISKRLSVIELTGSPEVKELKAAVAQYKVDIALIQKDIADNSAKLCDIKTLCEQIQRDVKEKQ